jgi:MFS family permease
VKVPLQGRLWRHPDFLKLWIGQTVDLFGGQVTDLALPTLAILLLHASPFQVGLLVALEFVGYPALGLIAGVWADRLPRRPMMLIANVGPMLALASVPMAFALKALTIYQLFAVALLLGVFGVFFEVAYQSYLPALIDRQDLVEGNQKLELSHSASHVAGPALGGFLIQQLGAAWAIISGAVSLFLSSLAILAIRKREPRRLVVPTEVPDFRRELGDGVRLVWQNPILRALTACSATQNVGAYMVVSVWLILAYRSIHLTAGQVGFILSAGSLGLIPAALAASALPRRLGLGRTLAVAPLVQGLGYLGIPLALLGAPIPILVLAWLLISSPSPVFGINQISLRQAITPDHLQGRMNATMRTVTWAALPVGSLLGGTLAGVIGVPQTIVLGALISLMAPLWLLSGPVIALRAQPQPVTP